MEMKNNQHVVVVLGHGHSLRHASDLQKIPLPACRMMKGRYTKLVWWYGGVMPWIGGSIGWPLGIVCGGDSRNTCGREAPHVHIKTRFRIRDLSDGHLEVRGSGDER